MKESSKLPITKLFGNIEENFYQLGLKEAQQAKSFYEHLSKFYKTSIGPIDSVLENILKKVISTWHHKDSNFSKLLMAYGQGLGKEFDKLALYISFPELMSTMSKWMPNVSPALFGCSSAFIWDEKNECPLHFRVFDYPMGKIYEDCERILITDFENSHKIMSLSLAAVPFSSITCMNDKGLSLALHQKFSEVFNLNGRSIFELNQIFMSTVSSVEEAIEFLDQYRSITVWSMYCSFSDGRIMSIELCGEENFYKVYDLKKQKTLYFNNLIENENINSNCTPHGMISYCEMRNKNAEKKLKKILKKESISKTEILKILCSPQTTKKEFELDIITPTSLVSILMDPKNQSAIYINSKAPKLYQGKMTELVDIFGKCEQKEINKSFTNEKHIRYQDGMRDLMMAQYYRDEKDKTMAYHHLQMSIEKLNGESIGAVAKFFFLVEQYLNESNKIILSGISKELEEIRPSLTSYLQDQANLFIARIEWTLYGKTKISDEDINHEYLKSIYKIENKYSHNLVHKITKPFIKPRLDILDILYFHHK